MTNSIENLIIGCKDWLRKDWQGNFYPEDMPEEWQLDFYSAQFPAVMVPQQQWQVWTDDEIEAISETLEDEIFYFVFELTNISTDAVGRLAFIKGELDQLAYGVMLEGEITVDYDLSDFAVTRVLNSRQHVAKSEWALQINDKVFAGAPMVTIDLDEFDQQQLKQLLSDFMNRLPDGQAGGILVVEGDSVETGAVKNLQVMAELMGY